MKHSAIGSLKCTLIECHKMSGVQEKLVFKMMKTNKLPTSHCDLITINIALKSKYDIDED